MIVGSDEVQDGRSGDPTKHGHDELEQPKMECQPEG